MNQAAEHSSIKRMSFRIRKQRLKFCAHTYRADDDEVRPGCRLLRLPAEVGGREQGERGEEEEAAHAVGCTTICYHRTPLNGTPCASPRSMSRT